MKNSHVLVGKEVTNGPVPAGPLTTTPIQLGHRMFSHRHPHKAENTLGAIGALSLSRFLHRNSKTTISVTFIIILVFFH